MTISLIPKLANFRITRSPYMPSPSRSRYRGAVSKGNASTIWWAVHCAVGCSVTLRWTILRRSCARTTKTNNTLNVAVGTTKKSIATRSFKCRSRNVRQVAEGNLSSRGLYLSTVDFATHFFENLILKLRRPNKVRKNFIELWTKGVAMGL